jgi:hypothetical protein
VGEAEIGIAETLPSQHQQNMFTYTNPPSDSLTDLTSSDDNYYASHRSSLRERFAFSYH